MKKITTAILVMIGVHHAIAQTNSFPSTGNAKIFAIGESWAEGLSIVRSSGWSGVRFTRNDPAGGNYNGNWAIGYNGATGNDFSFSTNYNGTQYEGVLHLSNSTRYVGIGTTSPEKTLDIYGDLQIRTNTFYKGASWQNIQSRFFSYGGNGTDAQWLIHTMPETGGRFVVASGPIGANGSSNQAFSIEGNKNSIFYANVGIGTTSPSARLQITGLGGLNKDLLVNGRIVSGDASNAGGIWVNSATTMFMGQYTTTSMGMYNNGAWRMIVDNSGNVGIGTTSPDYPLTVNGSIHAKEVRVDLTGALSVPDYVFEKDYKLASLEDIKTYIDQNKHLPEVPSAKEIEKNGVQLGEMNLILLKKIEELTLHIIKQEERIKALESQSKN